MTAVAMWVRAGLRERWRAWVGIALLIGLFSGAVLALAAGARRTDSAYERFLASSKAYDASVFYVAWTPAFAHLRPEDVESRPSVEESLRARLYMQVDPNLATIALGSGIGERFAIPKLLDGRIPEAADEVSVPIGIAETHRLRVGSKLTIPFLKGSTGVPSNERVEITFRVVGVHVTAGHGEFPPGAGLDRGLTLVSEAFDAANVGKLANFNGGMFRLRGGVDAVPTFTREIEPFAEGKPFFVLSQADQTGIANEATHLIAIALWVLAAGLGLVAFLSLGQTLARQVFIEGERYPIGRALGLTGPQLFAIGIVRALLIGVIAAGVAVLVAYLLSPLMPFGIARVVDPDPGLSFDAFVLGVGALGVLLAVVLVAVIPAWRAERAVMSTVQRPPRRSRAAALAFRAGLPAPAVAGIRLALEPGRGSTAVPIRSTLGAATIAIAALVVAFTFAASLDRLLSSPADYGITWDFDVETNGDPDQPDGLTDETRGIARAIAGLDGVLDAALADSGIPLVVEGHEASAITFDAGHPHLLSPLRAGRYPADGSEIALGAKTIEGIGKGIGDTVMVSLAGAGSHPFAVVGEIAVPGFDTASSVGEGALVTDDALPRFLDDVPPTTTVLVRLEPGADRVEMRERIAAVPGVGQVDLPDEPEDLRNLGRVAGLPLVLAAILACLAAAAVAHGAASSVRRRSRDLAIFRAIGFVQRQVRATVAWQAVTYVVAALLIGVPIGIAAGRWLWASAASELAVATTPRVSVVVLVGVPIGAALVAVAVSVIPARIAARARPATILRAP